MVFSQKLSTVSIGDSVRAIAEPMEASLLSSFNDHLRMERNASAQYFALAIWFAERELRGFSKFFSDESNGEQQHAEKFADYLISRGQSPQLSELPAPSQSWDSIEQTIAASFHSESDITTSLQNLYELSERSSDIRSTVFLDPIIEGQTKSEDEFAHLLGRVKFSGNDASAILILDAELLDGKTKPERF